MRREKPAAPDVGQLFAVYHQRVARWVRHLGGPRIDVEDAVQEVFLIAHRRLRRFEHDEELRAWMHRVAVNVVKEHRRRWQREGRLDSKGNHAGQRMEGVAAHGTSPSDIIARDESRQLIYEVFEQLSERSRTVLILFEIEELSGQEIAAIKGTKLATVWVWLHRARREFAQRLLKVEAKWKGK